MNPDQKLSHTPEFEIPPVPEAVSAPGSPHQTETSHHVIAPTEETTGDMEEKPVVAPTEEPTKEVKPRKAVIQSKNKSVAAVKSLINLMGTEAFLRRPVTS
ncbi:hypothetical protein PGTUg99_002740 [Puccinia graminis f. sp. tritici]|uniref:Uncharacterized protein n=1 Tax=Puccinia graminis f. sp. tritici TaxID=56615 RepID=A0A5B0M895_PUCGR|nr:hypothetical protein PGTUg99_002740 [Puccinia graminis f. sp. tritici]